MARRHRQTAIQGREAFLRMSEYKFTPETEKAICGILWA
nr:MAG TPA: hypothetical protein [Caudoviricetes sp.]